MTAEVEKYKLSLIVDVERARVETYMRQEERFRKIINRMNDEHKYSLNKLETMLRKEFLKNAGIAEK
jgi:hypothetical protein